MLIKNKAKIEICMQVMGIGYGGKPIWNKFNDAVQLKKNCKFSRNNLIYV